jgi:hypothetical protein
VAVAAAVAAATVALAACSTPGGGTAPQEVADTAGETELPAAGARVEAEGVSTSSWVAASPRGGFYVTGIFAGNAQFGPSFLVPGPAGEEAGQFIARLDGGLRWQWAVPLPKVAYAATPAADGGAYLVLRVADSISLGGNPVGAGIHLAKLSADGAWDWVRTVGEPQTGSVSVGGVAVTSAGDVVVAGSFTGTATFNGTDVTATAEGLPGARQTPDGRWELPADATPAGLAPSSFQSSFVAQLSPEGAQQWLAVSHGSDAQSVAAHPDGGAVVVGQHYSPAAFGGTAIEATLDTGAFAARLDGDGNWLWAAATATDAPAGTGGGAASATGVVVDAGGYAYVTGYVNTGNQPAGVRFGDTALRADADGSDDVVAVLSPDGSWQWAGVLPSIPDDGRAQTVGVAALPQGGAAVTGAAAGQLTFGDSRVDAGDGGVYLAYVAPGGGWLAAEPGPDLSKGRTTGAAIAVTAGGRIAITGGSPATVVLLPR